MYRLNSTSAPLNYLALVLAAVAIAPLDASAQTARAPEGTIEITVGCSAGCTPIFSCAAPRALCTRNVAKSAAIGVYPCAPGTTWH